VKENSYANVHIFFDEMLGYKTGNFLCKLVILFLVILFNELPIEARANMIYKIICNHCKNAAKTYSGIVIYYHFNNMNNYEEIFTLLFNMFEEEKIIVKKKDIMEKENLIIFSLAWYH
jgi:hypothetical protein